METPRTLLLGIGNVLWADEGFGVRCVEHLAERWRFPDGVHLMDGGTQGLYLLPILEEADALIVFDAVDYGLEPGTLKLVEGDDVPSFLGAKKRSLHQTGFQDVIATAELMGYRPGKFVLIGCQPEELEDYGGALRDVVAARIGPAVDIALGILRGWGIAPREGRADTSDLADPSIRHTAHEAEVYRKDDARFLPGPGAARPCRGRLAACASASPWNWCRATGLSAAPATASGSTTSTCRSWANNRRARGC